MARSGGVMSIPYPDFVNGNTADADQVDANNADIVAEITNSIAADGQTTITANIPMSGYKITGIGSGSAATDAVNLGQVQAGDFKYDAVGGTKNALTLSPTPAITAYAAGQEFIGVIGGTASDDAVTIAVSGLATKAVQIDGSALSASVFLEANKIYSFLYDGTQFQATRLSPNLQNSLTSADILDEDDFSSDSATKAPSQQSTKAYVDGKFSPVTRTVNAQTGTSYTLVAGDTGDIVTMSNASANTLTIPTNASVAFPVGTQVDVVMIGAGTTSIAGDTGVTLNGVSAGSGDMSAQYGGVTLLKIATDSWTASGAIGAVA